MAESRLGRYIVQHRYRVDPVDHEQLKGLLVRFRDWMLDLGVASFEVWQDEGDGALFTELVGYDSWSHHRRVASKSPSASMEEALHDFERLVIGGWEGVETREFIPTALQDDG